MGGGGQVACRNTLDTAMALPPLPTRQARTQHPGASWGALGLWLTFLWGCLNTGEFPGLARTAGAGRLPGWLHAVGKWLVVFVCGLGCDFCV